MAENKTKPTKLSVNAFINALTDQTRRADARTLVKLLQSETGEKPTMWGPAIIGFGSYHYVYDSGREGDSPLVGFSPRKAATVIYINTNFSGAKTLLSRLGKYSAHGICLNIKKLADVDLNVLAALVEKSTAAMRKKHLS